MDLTEQDLCNLRDAMNTDNLLEALEKTEKVIKEIVERK